MTQIKIWKYILQDCFNLRSAAQFFLDKQFIWPDIRVPSDRHAQLFLPLPHEWAMDVTVRQLLKDVHLVLAEVSYESSIWLL